MSRDGRVAFQLYGDIWTTIGGSVGGKISFESENLVQLTSGAAWDREPAWSPDGNAVVFSSDRNGNFDLWSIAVGAGGATGGPVVLVDSPEPERQPVVTADGSIVFVRGRGPSADLWILRDGDSTQQITRETGGETSPSVSSDGSMIAYVATRGRTRELRVRYLADDEDRLVVQGRAVEHPVWAPQGDAIAFSTRSGDQGVWITPVDGRYVNLISEQQAEAEWLPGGNRLILAELPRPGPGYNGDPDRVGDRNAADAFVRDGRLWELRLGPYPDSDLEELALAAPTDRARHNVEVFDRVWSRTGRLYYEEQGSDAWHQLRSEYRRRAEAASSKRGLDLIVDEMLVHRPRARAEVSGSAAVSSAHPLATQAGVEMLRRGGNVIDAAVAVSFALGVVEPDASGIGGYGEMLLYLERMDRPVVIEFLSRVPEQGGLNNAALLQDGDLPPDGPVLANVPGTVAGMWEAWEDYGSGNLEWAELVQPAIDLAKDGFPLSDGFSTTLMVERERFLKYESSRALFFSDGSPIGTGETFRNPDLAWTLQQIADGGAEAFYQGAIATRLVQDLRGKGNAVTLRDMARYYAAKREPVSGEYHGHTIYSAAPAAGGGASLLAKLILLDNLRARGLYSSNVGTVHAMIEAWKLAPSVRIADPGLWPVDLKSVLDKKAGEERWQRCFDPDRSLTVDDLTPVGTGGLACMDEQMGSAWEDAASDCLLGDDCRASGTTAFAVADAHGNIVAVTQTLGTWGGNFYVTPGLGFLYNDKLRSYSRLDHIRRLPDDGCND